MTQEEKAKAYDEVLNKLRRFIEQGVDPLITRADVQDFFPELAESEDEKIRKWIINEIKIKHHNLDEENVDFVDKAIAWLEKQGNMTERVIWKEIPKDKDGFFDDNSDLYDRLPIIITEEFKDFINLYYIDKENWHETVADFSRQRFVHYIEVRELKTK